MPASAARDQHFPFCAQVTRRWQRKKFLQRRAWLAQFPAITPFSDSAVPSALDRSSERESRPGTFCEVGRGLLISSIWSGL